jgi:hypothetical protein
MFCEGGKIWIEGQALPVAVVFRIAWTGILY